MSFLEIRKNLLKLYNQYPHEGTVYNIIDSAYNDFQVA